MLRVVVQAQYDILVDYNPDMNYLRHLLVEMLDPSNSAIDPRRVYVMGSGNGADMAYRVACDMADVVTGERTHILITFP